MVLLDGYLDYRSLSVSEFVTESLTWGNDGLTGVICDDQEDAIADLYAPLVSINASNGRDLRIYDANDGKILVYNAEPDVTPDFSDHIFDWMYLEERERWTPPTNVLDEISYELVRKEAQDEGYYAVFFIQIPIHIRGLDRIASQISNDYTYGNQISLYHPLFKRELERYYIYNQDTDTFYDFKTFTR